MTNEASNAADKPIFIFHAVKTPDIPYFSVFRGFAQDTGLSYEAAGLLLYLLSKPSTWRIHPKTLQRVKCGKNRVYSLLGELIERGYVRRETFRGERGRIDHIAYYVYPSSQLPANHEHVNHDDENADIRNKREGRDKRKKNSPAAAEGSTAAAVAITREQWDALLIEIGNVFKAHGPEAIQYANMLTGKAKKGVFGQCAITPPVLADELRVWWKSYRAANPNIALVKEPPKVYSAIAEYRQTKPATRTVNGTDSRRKAFFAGAWVDALRLSPDYTLDGSLRPAWMLAEIPAAGEYAGLCCAAGEKVYHDGSLPLAWQGLE